MQVSFVSNISGQTDVELGRGGTDGAVMAEKASRRVALTDEDIYRRIHASIAAQALPPGTRLREDEIRRIFGVSRTRIRAVFARLAYAGLVSNQPNRGASVAKPSVQEARDLFAARRAVEAAIVREAARRMSLVDEKRLHEHIRLEEAAEIRRDRSEMIRLSGEFHLLVAAVAGNAVLSHILSDLVTRESLVIAAYEAPGRPSCSNHEHRDILDALVRGDAEAAGALMIDHLSAIEGRLAFDEAGKPTIDLAAILA
jgi:DNA-binding GntR family transcriptional regulator